jgi:hypothetical protein
LLWNEGWERHTYGYHGDDGQIFHNRGRGTPWGPRYTTGDTVGCGINFKTKEIFFTKNGQFLGSSLSSYKISIFSLQITDFFFHVNVKELHSKNVLKMFCIRLLEYEILVPKFESILDLNLSNSILQFVCIIKISSFLSLSLYLSIIHLIDSHYLIFICSTFKGNINNSIRTMSSSTTLCTFSQIGWETLVDVGIKLSAARDYLHPWHWFVFWYQLNCCLK